MLISARQYALKADFWQGDFFHLVPPEYAIQSHNFTNLDFYDVTPPSPLFPTLHQSANIFSLPLLIVCSFMHAGPSVWNFLFFVLILGFVRYIRSIDRSNSRWFL